MFHNLRPEEGELVLDFVTSWSRMRTVDFRGFARLLHSSLFTLLKEINGVELNLNLPLE